MPKPHSTVAADRALVRRMGARPRGIIITAAVQNAPPMASIYVAGLSFGSLTQSQKDAFTLAFANMLNVSPGLLTLTFENGSLIIGITINSSKISTAGDDAFVTNAQSVLSRISNSDITNTIINSGTDNVIVGIPSIDPSKSVVNIDPALQSDSLSKYTAYTINNRIVADNVRNCIYTLINSMLVRITSNGNIESICVFPESYLNAIFITQDKSWLVIPTYNLIGDVSIPDPNYLGPHADVIYVISIASGVVYTNNLTIHFSYPYFGFNEYNNSIYYYSGEAATFGERCVAQIDFKTRTITSSIVQMPLTSAGESITASSVFTDLGTEFLSTTTKIIRRNLTNNTIREIDGFNYISDICFDNINNRILILDRGTSQVKSIELTTGNYQVTIIAGIASGGQFQLNTKVNSTYALSKFVDPSNLTLFNNTILVLDRTGTRVLSNGYVNDMFVLGTSTDTVTLSSVGGGPSVTFKISTASYNTLTTEEINTLKYKFLELYPNIDPNGVTFDLSNGSSIIANIKYNDSMIINLFRQKELACLSNFRSVFSDTPKILDNFKNAVRSANLESNFNFSLYGTPVVIASGFAAFALVLDSARNIYITDFDNAQIKKITPSGVVTIIANILGLPPLAVDSADNVYFSDYNTTQIKKITPSGVVTIFANGWYPNRLVIDSADNVYAFYTNGPISKITPAGVVTVIANGGFGYGAAIDSADNIYMGESNNQIKKITPAGVVTVFATGISVEALAVDSADNVYASDNTNYQIKKITPAGVITVIASGFQAFGLAIDSANNIYGTNADRKQIKKITLGPTINDNDVTVNIDDRIVKKCKEFLTPLNPLIMCTDINGNNYVTDLKDSILKLNINDGTTTILATLPATITTYTMRILSFLGGSSDGRYLTIHDDYLISGKSGNTLIDYVYRIDTTNGLYAKVVVFPSPTDILNRVFYNKFTDTLFYTTNNSSFQPVPYKFTGLTTFVQGISTEKFPLNVTNRRLYLDANTLCYGDSNVIKKWNLLTGVETNIIGVRPTLTKTLITLASTVVPSSDRWGKYNYTTSPVTFASLRDFRDGMYDSVTDILAVIDGPAKVIVLIKNVLNGTAFVYKVIGTPNPDLDANGYVNNIVSRVRTDGSSNGMIFYDMDVRNVSGTNAGLISNVVLTQPAINYISLGGATQFIINFNREFYNSLSNYNDYWKSFTVSKVQGNRVVPFSMFNTTTPKGLTITAAYSTSTASIYVAGLTLGTLTQTQKDAFTTELARVLGITPSLISLTFTAGSLIIDVSINNSNIITADDNAFVVNADAILSQLTNLDMADIITNSGCGTSITGTANIDHDRTIINIDIKLRNDCRLKYKNTTIYNPIVGDDVNKCMYTVLDSKIVRINKNGKVVNICNFPESSIRDIFITSDKSHLVIPTSIFSRENINEFGQTNLPYIASHANKIYVINISTGTIYVNSTTVEFVRINGYNSFTDTIYYQSSETNSYLYIHQSVISKSNSNLTSIRSVINSPNLTGGNRVIFSATNTFLYCVGGVYLVNIGGSVTRIAGLDGVFGAWSNFSGYNSWNSADSRIYSPFADASIGKDAAFNLPSSFLHDNLNNRILLADTYNQRIRAIELSNTYPVTTIAGTSPVKYGNAINGPDTNYSPQLLATLGQVGLWDNPISGMPAFNKVNSSYLTSTFDRPSRITLFDNKLLVLDVTGTRLLSNGRVSDFTVLIQ
jgi:hypothetical protein